MKKVAVGGTFDILHKGHQALLKKAFELGEVTIGLSSDKFAKKLKRKILNNFKERKRNLEEFLRSNFGKEAKIVKIEDIFGETLKKDFDYLVVSEETFKNACQINKKRKKLGKKEIEIVKIETVLAEDGRPISSTRIRDGEIDQEGRECVFCKIVKGKLGAFKIFENKKFLAFLDKRPKNPGHTLLIPKKHFRWVWDIPYIDEFFKVAKKIAEALRKAFKTEWIVSLILGDEIWHAHLHLIPKFKEESSLSLIKEISEREMEKIQRKIKRAL